jgi:hypothetical protein
MHISISNATLLSLSVCLACAACSPSGDGSAGPAVGTGSGDGGTPSSTSGTHECSPPVDICVVVPVASVNDACTASLPEVFDRVDPQTSELNGTSVRSCGYEGPTEFASVHVQYTCNPRYSAAEGFALDRNGTSGRTVEDVSGLGDEAFFRLNTKIADAQELVVRTGNAIVNVNVEEARGTQEEAKACLAALARKAISAP